VLFRKIKKQKQGEMSMAGEMLGEKNQEKLFSIILKREEN